MLLAEGFRSGFHRLFFALRKDADAGIRAPPPLPAGHPARPPPRPPAGRGLRRAARRHRVPGRGGLLAAGRGHARRPHEHGRRRPRHLAPARRGRGAPRSPVPAQRHAGIHGRRHSRRRRRRPDRRRQQPVRLHVGRPAGAAGHPGRRGRDGLRPGPAGGPRAVRRKGRRALRRSGLRKPRRPGLPGRPHLRTLFPPAEGRGPGGRPGVELPRRDPGPGRAGPDHPGHGRSRRAGRPAQGPRVPGPADRAVQPAALQRPPRGGPARAVRHRRRRPAPGPGRLQGSQRHPGPPRRGPAADRGRPAAAGVRPPERRCSTPGW